MTGAHELLHLRLCGPLEGLLLYVRIDRWRHTPNSIAQIPHGLGLGFNIIYIREEVQGGHSSGGLGNLAPPWATADSSHD